MRKALSPYRLKKEQVVRLWLARQGLSRPHGNELDSSTFVEHLERTGGLQLDSVNVLSRAHTLTLWSRFGVYDPALVDRWTYVDRIAYEYWGHEASILPASRLPLSRRAMARFEPRGSWWASRVPSNGSIRRVLRRIRQEGPLESADFEHTAGSAGPWWGWKEDKQSLEMLWHRGKLATSTRKSFRRVYDLAERVYGEAPAAPLSRFEDSWLITGLRGNGAATEKHLAGYYTSPQLSAADRKKVIARNLERGAVVEVEVGGLGGKWYILPAHLEDISALPAHRGTTLICPFDSLLWQRNRAEELLDFRYRIEIYTPPAKRVFGYYVMPILHNGRLVGRLDPKLHRERQLLEIKSIRLEQRFKRSSGFDAALASAVRSLASFVAANDISLPRGFKKIPI